MLNKGINFPWFYDDGWKHLDTLIKQDPDALIASLKRWGTLVKDDEGGIVWQEHDPNILPIASYLYNTGFAQVVDCFSDNKDLTLLQRCQRLVEIYNDLEDKQIPKPKQYNNDSAWVTPYPDELHQALHQLNGYHAQAQKVAQQHLEKYFPSSEKLQQQIQILQQKVAGNQKAGCSYSNLQARLEMLQQRIENPRQLLSPALLQKLSNKLQHAAYSGVLNQWYAEMDKSLQQNFCDSFELSDLPEDSLGDPRHLKVLMALLPLSTKTRAVAKQILQARLQAKPWDLRHHEANQKFLHRLQQLGINTAPWLDGIGQLEYEVEDKKSIKLTIELEADPLEIFHMGSHFQTCLSAFDFNFFSVVANVADINKRIIYLCDVQKKIVGRCLFALNNQGHLLNFWAYSHLGEDAIKPAVDYFADQLAKKMQTIRSHSGVISTLVAHDWYDDGAASIDINAPSFVEDKVFRKQLLTLPLERAKTAMEALFDREVLKPIIMQHLLRLAEFEQRPELSLAILDTFKILRSNDRKMRLQMAKYLHACGENNLALACLKGWRINDYQLYGYEVEYPEEEIELLITINPSFAYRVLNNSRVKAIQTDADDTDEKRLCYLAEIHQLLYRKQKAVICYQAAIATKRLGKKDVLKLEDKIEQLT